VSALARLVPGEVAAALTRARPARPPSMAARLRATALMVALAAAGAGLLALVGVRVGDFADALARAVQADWRWVALAALAEVLSFVGAIALFRAVAGRATSRVGLRASTEVTLAGAAVTRLLPTAGAGGVALTAWALRRAGLSRGDTARTLVSFLVLLYAVFMAALALSGIGLVTGVLVGDGPTGLVLAPAAFGAAVIVTALALAWAPTRSSVATPHAGAPPSTLAPPETGAPTPSTLAQPDASRAWALRARAALPVASDGVRDALAVLRAGDPRVLGALAWWGFDLAVLWATLEAFGAPPPAGVLVLAYFTGMIANTLPLPGAASAGLIGILAAFGVEPGLAIAAVLAYRAIALWLPAPFGAIALAGLARTVRGWSAPATPAAPAARRPERPRRRPPLPRAAEPYGALQGS
jgi:uncharacterized membrane protein YbhN (UPF0104 family)